MQRKGEKVRGPKALQSRGVGGHASTGNFYLGARKCYFLRYPKDILLNTKENANC